MKFFAACFYLLALLCAGAGDYFGAERENGPLGEESDQLPANGSKLGEGFRLRQRILLGAIRHEHAETTRPTKSRELEGGLVVWRP